jgi:hypothetical protein
MSSTVWKSSRLIIPPCCSHAQRDTGLSGHSVMSRIVAIHREWIAGLRCTIMVLQSLCSHVLLAFNALPATHLAGAGCQPCRVAP